MFINKIKKIRGPTINTLFCVWFLNLLFWVRSLQINLSFYGVSSPQYLYFHFKLASYGVIFVLADGHELSAIVARRFILDFLFNINQAFLTDKAGCGIDIILITTAITNKSGNILFLHILFFFHGFLILEVVFFLKITVLLVKCVLVGVHWW